MSVTRPCVRKNMAELGDRLLSELNDLFAMYFKHRNTEVNTNKFSLKLLKTSKSWGDMAVVCPRPLLMAAQQRLFPNDQAALMNDIEQFINHTIAQLHDPKNYIEKVNAQSNGLMHLQLNRLTIFTRLLPQVVTNNHIAKESTPKRESNSYTTLICPVYLCENSCPSNGEMMGGETGSRCTLSMEDGRVILVAGLLNSLIHTTGSHVQHTNNLQSLLVRKYAPVFCEISDPMTTPTRLPLDTENVGMSVSAIESDVLSRLSGLAGSGCGLVDGGNFIENKGLNGYSKNIKLIEVLKDGRPTVVSKMASLIYRAVDSMNKTMEGVTVVMVTSQRNSFRVQQSIILVSMLLSQGIHPKMQFKILEVGPVTCLSAMPTLWAEDYVCNKMAEMKQACEIKYGNVEKDAFLKNVVQAMTNACVKFDILATDPRKHLKVESIGSGGGQIVGGLSNDGGHSEGAFVLYNYARLATLVKNYYLSVEKGTYLPLPSDFSQINYSLLTNQEEWELVYNHLALYSSVLEESCTLTTSGVMVTVSQTGLKKFCQFLCKMCHAFSCYYSRHKVLLGPEPHLLPLVQARMTLVLALKLVLYSGLMILGIEPLEQL